VKLIGATAHYATQDLDEGPIIEQDVVRVNHREDAASLERIGATMKPVEARLHQRTLLAITAALGETEVGSLLSEGARLQLSRVLELALSCESPTAPPPAVDVA